AIPCLVPDSGWWPGMLHSTSSVSTAPMPARSPAAYAVKNRAMAASLASLSVVMRRSWAGRRGRTRSECSTDRVAWLHDRAGGAGAADLPGAGRGVALHPGRGAVAADAVAGEPARAAARVARRRAAVRPDQPAGAAQPARRAAGPRGQAGVPAAAAGAGA